MRRAQEEGKLARHGYSKVSLFGVSTLEALKYAVFENSQWTINGIRPPSVETLEDFLNVRKPAGHKVGKLPRLKQIFSSASKLPFLEKYLGGQGLRELAYMSVRNEIVCFDDFERRGDGLKVKDVLGLISSLRNERECKVVLILNDEKLKDEERADFEAKDIRQNN